MTALRDETADEAMARITATLCHRIVQRQSFDQLMVVVDDLRYDIDQAGGLCTWDDIYLGAWVRFGSDREGMVVNRYTQTLGGQQWRWLEIKPDEGPNFHHEWTDGEPCYLESIL